jgi:hypothetical protein
MAEEDNLRFCGKNSTIVEFRVLVQVSELKRINQFHTDADLHARRVIKVPAKGILVDLTEDATTIPLVHVKHSNHGDESDTESTNGQVYLENVDTVLKEIREKAENVAANSPILNDGSEDPLPATCNVAIIFVIIIWVGGYGTRILKMIY